MPREQAIASLVAVLGACILSSCAPTASGTDRAETTSATSTTTVELPAPTEGALRERIDGIGPTDATVATDEPGDVLLVGDSVLALVADDIARRMHSTLHVDAADCRRIDMAVEGPCGGVPAGVVVSSGLDAIEEAMEELTIEGVTPDAAVLVLADNSSLSADQLDEAMDLLVGIPQVWWVNTRIEGFGRQDPNNALLEALSRRDERAGVIDWFSHSEDRDYLADHVHPNEAGEAALARLIARHLRCGCEP